MALPASVGGADFIKSILRHLTAPSRADGIAFDDLYLREAKDAQRA